jgi:hypothetical protein
MVLPVLAKLPSPFRCVPCWALSVWLTATLVAAAAHADDSGSVLEFRYTPVARAQLAIWVEDANAGFVATVALTEAVAYRGIGNRPGASQMNSGYRWPYGRREGALPIWAHRRAAAPMAKLFGRVIFQNRSEGAGTRAVPDSSIDAYYCLQFDMKLSTRDKLDAVSCASVFNSDKGRYLTESDVSNGYAEPWQEIGRDVGVMRRLSIGSVYPPRMDVTRCPGSDCNDHADVTKFAADVREVMPDIDAVSRATAPGDMPQRVLFSVPTNWAPGDYVAFIEVNVEGDYNDHWNNKSYPTPMQPASGWDTYAMFYGYAYRGQPSIVYRVPFRLGDAAERSFAVAEAVGRSSWDYARADYGQLEPISLAAGDPMGIADSGGSGSDRLRRDADGNRFAVQVKHGTPVAPSEPTEQVDAGGSDGTNAAAGSSAAADSGVGTDIASRTADLDGVGPIRELRLGRHPNALRAHTWIELHFLAARSQRPIHEYEVRVATEPIVDQDSFIRLGRPAKDATDAAEGASALMLPVDVEQGLPIDSAIGDLVADTHYYVAVRATDDVNRHGPISVADITTTPRKFATVTPCFIASAAYGTPLAAQIGALRRLRDRYLLSVAPGRVLVGAYYAIGPDAAAVLEGHDALRAAVRWVLSRVVAAAQTLR